MKTLLVLSTCLSFASISLGQEKATEKATNVQVERLSLITSSTASCVPECKLQVLNLDAKVISEIIIDQESLKNNGLLVSNANSRLSAVDQVAPIAYIDRYGELWDVSSPVVLEKKFETLPNGMRRFDIQLNENFYVGGEVENTMQVRPRLLPEEKFPGNIHLKYRISKHFYLLAGIRIEDQSPIDASPFQKFMFTRPTGPVIGFEYKFRPFSK